MTGEIGGDLPACCRLPPLPYPCSCPSRRLAFRLQCIPRSRLFSLSRIQSHLRSRSQASTRRCRPHSTPAAAMEPSPPAPTPEPGHGLPFRGTPAVAANRAKWLHQIDKITALAGGSTLDDAHGIRSEFKDALPPPRSYANTFTFKANAAECTERLRVYRDMGALRGLSAPPGVGSYIQPLHGVLKPGKKPLICVDLSRNFND
jgi:hypothetical protein